MAKGVKGTGPYARAPRPKRRRSRSFHIPVAVVAGFVPVMKDSYTLMRDGGLDNWAKNIGKRFIPYDFMTGKFTFDKFWVGTGSIIMGILVHRFVGGMLGVNRALAQARIPFIRV